MSTIQDLWAQALSLPPEQRAELAHGLLLSLDDQPPGIYSDQELEAELNRRIAAHDADPSKAIPWRESIESLRLSHSGR